MTLSQRPERKAPSATPRCPEWGGSKLPPKKAVRIKILSEIIASKVKITAL
jgi:hypothetical protein